MPSHNVDTKKGGARKTQSHVIALVVLALFLWNCPCFGQQKYGTPTLMFSVMFLIALRPAFFSNLSLSEQKLICGSIEDDKQ